MAFDVVLYDLTKTVFVAFLANFLLVEYCNSYPLAFLLIFFHFIVIFLEDGLSFVILELFGFTAVVPEPVFILPVVTEPVSEFVLEEFVLVEFVVVPFVAEFPFCVTFP